jgi:dihydroorotate dehydrogenase electron transfer subunit
MRLFDAELLDSREILPAQWLHHFRAPWLAAAARAGQFVHVRTGDHSGLVLRRPFTVDTIDRPAGVVSLHFAVSGIATRWLSRMRPGERLEMLGPLGRGWEVDPRSQHLLLVTSALGIAAVRALVDESIERGRQVTILYGARTAAEVYPSSLLPDEVEYLVATEDGSLGHRGGVADLVPEYEAWADQAFAAGPEPMLAELARLARGRDGRMGVARLGRRGGPRPGADPPGSVGARRKAWLQVQMRQQMGCAVGACLGCVVIGVQGPQRVCREGPVFAADEIAWPDQA